MLWCLSFAEIFVIIPQKRKKIIVFICSAVFVVISSIYAGPVGDFQSYKQYFINNNHLDSRFELGYALLNIIVRHFTRYYWVFRMILAIIVMMIWMKVISSDRYPMTMLFILWSITFCNIFIVRSTIAVAICTYSIKYIKNKNFRKFCICLFFAISFHTMSIIWLLAYFIYYKDNLKKLLYYIIAISAVFSSFIPKITIWVSSFMGSYINNRITHYISYGLQTTATYYSYGFTVIKAVANIGLLIAVFECVCHYKKKSNTMDDESHLLNLYLVGSIIYILTLFSSVILSRAALLYNAAQFFLLPRVFDVSVINKSRVIKLAAFVVLSVYLFLRMYYSVQSRDYIPFNVII